MLHVESNRILALLKFLSCYYWCGVIAAGGSARRECKEGAQVTATVTAGGSLRVTFMLN